MSNKGIDVELSFRNTWGDFGFDGSVVMTTYKNKIPKIAEGITFFDLCQRCTATGSALHQGTRLDILCLHSLATK